MCNRFIDNFANKVIEKSICCKSCRVRRKLCKNLKDEYIHLDVNTVEKLLFSGQYIYEELYENFILSFLHNEMFLNKMNLREFIYCIENLDFVPKLKKHDCFNIPTYIISIGLYSDFNELKIYDSTEDYYNDPYKLRREDYYDFKLSTFKEWLDKTFY